MREKNSGVHFLLKISLILLVIVGYWNVCVCAETGSTSQVVVYYFYGHVRCVTCHKIENYTKETVSGKFQDQESAGQVVFKPVNIDEPANNHYISDYGLFTKSVVVSLQQDGKEVQSKNLAKIWEYVGNKDKFSNYIGSEIGSYLKEIK